MGIDQIAPQALKLPTRERAQLASSLWESIGDPYTQSPNGSDEEALLLAISRDEEIESGRVIPLTHAEMMQRLRS